MKGQTWYIACLVGLMCIVRFSISAIGYVNPHVFMEEIGISLSSNPQMPYAIRAWAVRDLTIAILVALANKNTVKALLIGCVIIDFTDIISAYLIGVEGLFGTTDGWLLKLTSTAIAALFLELGALVLLSIDKIKQDTNLDPAKTTADR